MQDLLTTLQAASLLLYTCTVLDKISSKTLTLIIEKKALISTHLKNIFSFYAKTVKTMYNATL